MSNEEAKPQSPPAQAAKSSAEGQQAAGQRKSLASRIIPPALVVCALAGVVALAVLVKGRDTTVAPAPPPPVNVTVMKVTAEPQMADTFDLPAVIEPKQVVRVAAEVAGRIQAETAEEGKPVQQGQELVRLNTDLLKAEFDQAAAQQEFSQRDLERVSSLADRGFAKTAELDQARTHAAADQLLYNAVKARLDRAVIAAPVAGVLNRLPLKVGEYVLPGACAAEIVQIDDVLAVVQVPEKDIGFFKLGQEHEVLLSGCPPLPGKITYLSELADEQTRSTRVEITVDNRQRCLHSGQIVQVRLTRRQLRDVVMIPLQAVVPLENGRQVFVVEDGKAQPRRITLGFFRGSSVQVLAEGSELKPGELLIMDKTYVAAGQAVKVQAAQSDAGGWHGEASMAAAGGHAPPCDSTKNEGKMPSVLAGETPAGRAGQRPTPRTGETPMPREREEGRP